jgi:hypothetical protein
MKVVSSFIPPVTQQPRLNGNAEKTNDTREVFAELVDDTLSVPVTAVVELDETQSQFESPQRLFERVDLRSLSNADLPLNNQRALESYQTVAGNGSIVDAGLSRLDVIV